MKISKYFVVFGLSLLVGACDIGKGELDIDIGDYEAQLAAWNSQNMLDYLISVEISSIATGLRDEAVISVKNGNPECSDPPSWLEEGRLSTIPEFYSFVKEVEERKRKEPKNEYSISSLKVSYDTEYHYPNYISDSVSHGSADGAWTHREYFVTLTPLGET
ncbi:MAG: DUF6174 domain-containing protein [Treponema sp.]|jgi:hypothetical protein|nr:DUF6174 domain-containing protein [Treponema sp.]